MQKPNRRKSNLWALFLIPLLPVLVTLAGREGACSETVDVSIGVQDEGVPSWKASLQRLAQEVQRCPHAEKFVIRYKVPLGAGVWARAISPFRRSYRTTIYYRSRHLLRANSYEEVSDFEFTKVTDTIIQRVAAQDGNFDDFMKFGCVNESM